MVNAYTGKSNQEVLDNLRKLVDMVGAEKICVRLPLIPEFNTKEDRNRSKEYILESINQGVMIDVFDYIRC